MVLTSGGWLLQHMVRAWYASYWNAFLLLRVLTIDWTDGNGCRSLGLGSFGIKSSGSKFIWKDYCKLWNFRVEDIDIHLVSKHVNF